MEAKGPNFSQDAKRAAVELWKAKVPLKNSKATSLTQLQEEIAELWVLRMENIEYLKNLVESMPRRLQAIIDGNGNLTKY